MSEPRARSPQQVALETGLSLCSIYGAIHAGELRAVKRRSRWLIQEHEVRRFLGEPVAPVYDTPATVAVKARLAGGVLRMVQEALGGR